MENTFISTGFSNWKDATARFTKHEASQCHKEAVLKAITLPATTSDVGEMLSSQLARESLARLPFRGNSDEVDSNYMRLISLLCEDNAMLVDWMKKKTDKYTSGKMQNEMVKVMALRLLREVVQNLHKAAFFTVIADETTDVSNVEQVVICLRWVSEDFEVREDFVGLYEVASTGAEIIYSAIINVLQRLNLALFKVRGQCYDGAATMSGAKSGVVTRMCQAEPSAVFTHCYGHSL